MKKIMFNDKYRLTEAVLSKRKTQTRRVIKLEIFKLGTDDKITASNIQMLDGVWRFTIPEWKGLYNSLPKESQPKYNIGEVVAIAQSYKNAEVNNIPEEDEEFGCYNFPAEQTHGWDNKMFVRADLMPHQIRITNVRVERLQDISDEDCIKEGITSWKCGKKYFGIFDYSKDFFLRNSTAREAYAVLIDKISGKGTWNSNPWVFVYDFELVK